MPRDLLGVLFVAWCLNWSKKMASSELRGVPNHVQPVTSSWDRLGSKTARATYLGNAKHTKEAAPLLKKHLGSYLYAKQKPYRSLSKDSRSRKKRANSNPQSLPSHPPQVKLKGSPCQDQDTSANMHAKLKAHQPFGKQTSNNAPQAMSGP